MKSVNPVSQWLELQRLEPRYFLPMVVDSCYQSPVRIPRHRIHPHLHDPGREPSAAAAGRGRPVPQGYLPVMMLEVLVAQVAPVELVELAEPEVPP